MANAGQIGMISLSYGGNEMKDAPRKEKHDWIEEIEIVGDQLVGRIKELIKEGNVRRLIIRKSGVMCCWKSRCQQG